MKEKLCAGCKKPISLVGRNVCNKCIEKAVKTVSKNRTIAKNKNS